MIDRLRSIARAAGGLAIPSLILAVACLAHAVFIVFTSSSHEDDRYLFPSILVFMWALSVYGFIETFKYVPERLDDAAGFFRRMQRRLSRLWYWIVGLVFLGTSIAVVALTLRALSVWLGDYAVRDG